MSKLCLFETERSLLRAKGKTVDRLSSESPVNTKPANLVVGRTRKSFQHRYYSLSDRYGALFSVLMPMGVSVIVLLLSLVTTLSLSTLERLRQRVVTTSN